MPEPTYMDSYSSSACIICVAWACLLTPLCLIFFMWNGGKQWYHPYMVVLRIKKFYIGKVLGKKSLIKYNLVLANTLMVLDIGTNCLSKILTESILLLTSCLYLYRQCDFRKSQIFADWSHFKSIIINPQWDLDVAYKLHFVS